MLITLAVEKSLSESVARRLINAYIPKVEVIEVFGLAGFNSVKRRIPGLNHRARYADPVLAIADLDNPQSCAPLRIQELTGGLTIAPDLLIRIAALEIESWIMADREGIAKWLSVAASIIPRNPESLNDPKRELVHLARRSRNRRLRQAIAPAQVLGTSRTGPDYNETVGEFVARLWNPDTARRHAPSLERAIRRIAELATTG